MSLEFRFQVFDSRFTNDTMTEAEMKKRTQSFSLRILKLAEALPRTRSGNMIATQIVRRRNLCSGELSRPLPIEIARRLHQQDRHRGRRSRRNFVLARHDCRSRAAQTGTSC